MEESPPRRSPFRSVLRRTTATRSPRRSSSFSTESPTKVPAVTPAPTEQVPAPRKRHRKKQIIDFSTIPQIRINITRLENLQAPKATATAVTTTKPRPKDRPMPLAKRLFLPLLPTKSLPISIQTSRLHHLPPPPPLPAISDKELEMAAVTELIEISDDEELHIALPQPTPTAPPEPLPAIDCSPRTEEVKTVNPSESDVVTKSIPPQEGLQALASPEIVKQSPQDGYLSGFSGVNSAPTPNENSEEIVVSVSAESILAMEDQEVETTIEVTTTDEAVSNSPLLSSNAMTAIVTSPDGEREAQGVIQNQMTHVAEVPLADPTLQTTQQLRRIQKPTGVIQSSAQRLHTHTCYICLKTMSTHHEFLAHRLVHPDNKCPDCGKVMDSYKQLKGHVIRKIQKGCFSGNGTAGVRGRPPRILMPNQHQHPKQKYPPVSSQVTTSSHPPAGQGAMQHTSTNVNGQVMPSSWDYNTSSPGRQRAMSDDFDEIFPPHFMDLDSILDVEKLKGTFDIHLTPLPASQFEPSGMTITPTWQHQGTSGGTVQNGCGVGNSLSICSVPTPPPPPSYVIARRQHNSANPPQPSVYYPPTPSGNQLRACLQNPSISRGTAGHQAQAQAPLGFFPAPVPSSTTTISTPASSPFPAASRHQSGGSSLDYKSYKDLLEPLAKIKKFAMDEVDGAIVFTVHELERHVMTKIMSMSTSSKDSTSPN